jgi:[acyl-carrier-protein] S-malonyltransferase
MTQTTNSALAMVFPGQGSQTVGMLGELAAEHSQIGETFAEAADALGYDLWALVSNGPVEELNQTHRTQPALLASSVALWRVWQAIGGSVPAAMAGHSLGEYSALVCAGSIGLADALRLVEARGRYMQEAVPAGEGAMAAILGLTDEQVEQACLDALTGAADGEVVSAANYNSPGQVVVAGSAAAVARAMAAAKAAGAKRAVPLAVSAPSHCALMRPAAERLQDDLARLSIAMPGMPVFHNADGAMAISSDDIKHKLVQQLHSPVRWVQCVQAMAAAGATLMIETGPGKVLSGLGRRIDKSTTTLPAADPAALDNALAAAAAE